MFKNELYERINGSKEEVEEAFKELTLTQQNKVIEIFGINSSRKIYKGNSTVIEFIQRKIDKKYKKNLFSLFPDKNENEILIAFKSLSEKDKSVLLKYFVLGNQRERITSTIDNKEINKALRKLNNRLFNLNRKKIDYKSIYLTYNTSKEQMKIVMSLLDEQDRNLLYKKYGETLEDNTNKSDLTLDENKYIGTILSKRIKRIIYKLNNGYEIIEFFDLFSDIPKETLLNRFKTLSDTQKNEWFILFGNNLSKKILLNKNEKEIILNSEARRVSIRTLYGKEFKMKEKFTPFYDLFLDFKRENESIKEFETRVNEAFDNIKEEYKELTYKKYGKDLRNTENHGQFTKEDSKKIFRYVYYSIRYYLTKEKKDRKGKTIMERLKNHGTHKEILIALCNLEKEELELLRKYYGLTLSRRPLEFEISSKEQDEIKYVLDKVCRIIMKNKSIETGLTSEKLKKIRSIMFTPIFKELSKTYDNKILYAYLISLKYPELSEEIIYKITTINLSEVKDYIYKLDSYIQEKSLQLK